MIYAGTPNLLSARMGSVTQIELITGPAGSGKTGRCLAAYRDVLRRSLGTGRPAAVLWIAPTDLSRRAVLASLCDESLSVAFAPNVETFASLSTRILEFAPVRGLDPAVKRRVLRNLIDELNAAGRLGSFAGIAGTGGFLDLVDAFIAELKRAEIWPEDFTAVCERIGNREKDRVLGELYARYQQRLHESDLYDDEGKFWSARDTLSREGLGRFADRELIVVDGFTDFTRTQRETIALLAAGCRSLRITLPLDDARDDLFAKSREALQRMTSALQSLGGVALVDLARQPSDRSGWLPAIRHIGGELFRNPRDVTRSADAGGIRVLAVTGANAEVDVVAHRVKSLLHDGTEPAGVVVAVRSLDDAADLWRARFTAAGIPFWCSAGSPLLREPLVRSLLEVLRLEREDWPFERLKAVLLSNYFRPAWKLDGMPSRVSRLLQFLRKKKLHKHRHIMGRVLKRLSENHAAEFELFQRLDAALHPLRSETDFAGWVDRLAAVCWELGIASFSRDSEALRRGARRRDVDEIDERDHDVWDRLKRVLYDTVRAAEIAGTDDSRMSLSDFIDAVIELLQSQELPASTERQGRVWIVEADQVRNLDVPHLFLAGLTEQSFPRVRGDDCLYLERERREFHRHGLDLRHRSAQSQDEMLLFYGIVTRARQSLTLSYAEVGSSGQPLFCSPFVTSLMQLFEPDALPVERVGGLDPVPQPQQILTPADWRAVAVDELHAGRPALFRSFAGANGTTARSILTGADANAARFATVGWTSYDGELRRAAIRETLHERYAEHYEFSASQFESYAYCRFRFFLEHVLHIKPLESPAVATDYAERGNLVHDALAEVHRELLDASEDGSILLATQFREKIEARLKRRVSETELAVALTEVERRIVGSWGDFYDSQSAAYLKDIAGNWEQPPRPRHVELPFGNPPETDQTPAEFEFATFGTGPSATRIRGRIDRVDVGQAGGKTVFNIIDYKTGKPPRFSLDDVKSGNALQLALYTLAVKRLGIVSPDARPFQMGYWCVRETGFTPGMKSGRKGVAALDDAVLEELEATLDELIPRLAAGIRGGHFPVDCEDDHCTDRCAYRTVCRITQLRPIRERLKKTRSDAPPIEG